jgi:hypothetical protein
MEIRILACKKYLDDLDLCIERLQKFLPHAKIFVHSDGTIEDWKPPRKVEFIPKSKADRLLDPELRDIRDNFMPDYPMIMKMIDLIFLSNNPHICVWDSDCFIVREPKELLKAMRSTFWIHGQGCEYSIGNAGDVMPVPSCKPFMPGAFLQTLPVNFIKKHRQKLISFLNKAKLDWCNEQGFLHLLLVNHFAEHGLSKDKYVSTDLNNIDWDKVEVVHTTGKHKDKEKIKDAIRQL